MNRVARVHEPIDEPIPAIGRFNHEALEVCLIRSEANQNLLQVIRESFIEHYLILFVDEDDHTVVGMKINAPVQLTHGSSLGWKVERSLTDPSTVSPRRGAF